MSVDYTVGHWSGTLASEVISSPWIPGGPISVDMTGITESDKFFQHLPMHGILGLAYKAIAKVSDGTVLFFTVMFIDSFFSLMGL